MADIVNLNFRADGDFGPFIAQVNRAMAVLSKFRNEKLLDPSLGLDKAKFDAAVDSFRSAVAQTGLYNSSVVNVTSSTEKFGKALAGQNLKLKEYYKAYVDFRRSTVGQIRMLAQEQVRIQNSVVKSLGRDIQGASKALVITPTGIDALANASAIAKQEVMIFNKVLRDGATSLINWGKNTQWAGRQLTVGLTLPIMLFGKTASEAFRKADAELTRLAKVYGGIGETSAAQLAEVRKNVAELSKTLAQTYGASFEETLALAADIAATGAEGNDLLAATAETTRLATLGEVDRQEAMKATLALQSAFKLNTTELTQSINMLNAVENQTSTTLQDLVEAIPKAGPVIKGLGGDVGTLALFLTAMREGGINAAEGANALKSGLASLINPTKQAVEKMQGFGININEIVNSNANDLVGLIFDLQAALDKLDPLQKQQAIEQLFGKYQFARIGALLNNIGREGSQSLQVLDIMKASTEDLAATADRELTALTESASGRYKRALETFKASLAEFGEPFLEVFTNILKVGGKLLEVFGGLPKPIKMFLAGIAGLTALAGPLIMLTGLFGNFLGYIIKGVAAFRQLRSGAGAFEMITTATVAADQVADAYTRTQYDQITATKMLRVELEKLEMAYYDIARAAMGGAPGPRPPGTGGGGGGGGGMPPIMPFPMGGGPMIAPGTPGVSGSITPISKAVTGYMEDLGPIAQRGLTKRQELEALLSTMSPEEADRFLMERVKGSQRSVESMGLGKNRGSAQVLPFTHAGLLAMGLASEGGEVRGQYREETGAGTYNIYGEVSGGHLDPVEKERVRKAHYEAAIKEGKTPAQAAAVAERRIAAGNVPEPKALGMAVGTMPGQEKLLTREGAMAVVIGEELMKEEYEKSKGKQTPFKRLGERFKAAKRSVAVADDLPIAPKEELRKLTQSTGLVSANVGGQPVVSTASGAGKTGGARTTPIPIPVGAQQIIDVDKLDDVEESTKKTSKNLRQSAQHAMKFSGAIAGSVGTLGMVSSMMMSMNGSTNQTAMNMANFLMYAGFAVPAIQGLGAGLRAVSGGLSKSTGLVGLLGRGLGFLGTGPGMIAIATVTTLMLGIKKLMDIHAETLRKARADISVSEEALREFGGAALTAKDKFETYVKTVEALRQKLINDSQAKGIPGLPTPEEIDKVKDQVKELFKDQIKRVQDISNKQEAIDFGRNLKSTLLVQGVEEKTASAIIASIFEQAGKETMSIPVLLDIAGITSGEQGLEQLQKAAQKTFDDISKQLEGGRIKQKVAQRFSEQLDLLSAAALAQVKDFDDLKNVINVLPEGMRDLTFEQLNATMAGKDLLNGIRETNPELYEAFKNAESLAAAIQLTAASSMGLTTVLGGVAGQFEIAAQNAMNMVSAQAYANSGIQEYYSRLIAGEQNTISRLRKRMKAELEANENRKKAIEDQIDLEKEKIDQIKEEADARRDLLREQQKQKDFEVDLAQLRLKQDVALRVGNFAEAAMIGLDIEKKMQDRSVDLAEKAITDKEKREVELHENKIKLLEEEKEKIKELTDEQKASIESRYNKLIEMHNKAIQKYREDAAKSAKTFTDLFNKAAAGNVTAYQDLQKLLKQTGGDLGILGNTFTEFLKKTVNSFSQAFGDSLAALLGPNYRVKDGMIQRGRPGPKGRGMKYDTVSTIADLFGIKTPYSGMGVSSEITGDEADTLKAPGTIGSKVKTKFGTFTVKEDYITGDKYVEYKNKYNDRDVRVPHITKEGIEKFITIPEQYVQPYWTGGPVSGPGTSTSDSIPAYLSDGEYVVRAAAVDHYGVETFDAMNAKRLKNGGPVGTTNSSQRGEYMALLDYFRRYGDLVVNFPTGRSDLPESQLRELKKIAELIRKSNTDSMIVRGFADQRGDSDTNLKLSQNRAEYIARALSYLVPGTKFIPYGLGELPSDMAPDSLARNRKVFVYLPPTARKRPTPTPSATPKTKQTPRAGIGTTPDGSPPSKGTWSKGQIGIGVPPINKKDGGLIRGYKNGGLVNRDRTNPFSKLLSLPGKAFNSMIQGWMSFGTSQSFSGSGASYKPKSISDAESISASTNALAEIYGINPAKRVASGTSSPVFGSKILGTGLDSLAVLGNVFTAASATNALTKAGKASASAKVSNLVAMKDEGIRATTRPGLFVQGYKSFTKESPMHQKLMGGIMNAKAGKDGYDPMYWLNYLPKKWKASFKNQFSYGVPYDPNDLWNQTFKNTRDIDWSNFSEVERIVGQYMSGIKYLNPKFTKELFHTIGQYLFMGKSIPEDQLPAFVEGIKNSGVKSIFETYFARHRNKTPIANLGHPKDVEVRVGRTRGPGLYAATTSGLSKNMYDFGEYVYRMAMSPTMLAKLATSKGYIRGTDELNDLIARYNVETGDAMFLEGGMASGVSGGLADIPWDHPFIQWAMKQGYVGYRHGVDQQALTNWLVGTKSGYRLKPTKMAMGGYVGKLHTWNGPVPGPYGQEVAATLKAGTEGVYQTQYINNLQKDASTPGDCVYNINVNVTNPGATADQIANAIEAKMRLTNQRMGTGRTVTH